MQNFLTALMAAAITLFGQIILSGREEDAKMVEIAIGILRAEPKPEIAGARAWAVRVINRSSPIKLEKDEQESLIKNAIPYVPSLDLRDPRNSQFLPLLH